MEGEEGLAGQHPCNYGTANAKTKMGWAINEYNYNLVLIRWQGSVDGAVAPQLKIGSQANDTYYYEEGPAIKWQPDYYSSNKPVICNCEIFVKLRIAPVNTMVRHEISCFPDVNTVSSAPFTSI